PRLPLRDLLLLAPLPRLGARSVRARMRRPRPRPDHTTAQRPVTLPAEASEHDVWTPVLGGMGTSGSGVPGQGVQMGPVHPDRRVFQRGDNVLAYWVDHAEGCEVRSGVRSRARVDAVVLDPRRGRANALIVRSARLNRRRVIPVEAVVGVDPFARRLEV